LTIGLDTDGSNYPDLSLLVLDVNENFWNLVKDAGFALCVGKWQLIEYSKFGTLKGMLKATTFCFDGFAYGTFWGFV